MKDRCIKKPFDTVSWCDQTKRKDMLMYDIESILLNLINHVNTNFCSTCFAQIYATMHIKFNKLMDNSNEA